MPTPKNFIKVVKENKLGPFIGVPCTILAPLISYIIDYPNELDYYNPTNEAHALGLAAGFYIGNGEIPIVFMQNSGLGNIINPLTSLNQIYRIPAILLVTWRGFGGAGADAPEHDIMGRDLEEYLKVLHIPYEVLSEKRYVAQILKLKQIAQKQNIPVAAIVKDDFFKSYKQSSKKVKSGLDLYEAIKIIKQSLDKYIFLSTTGFTSRESYKVKRTPDFYMLGSMGLVSAIGCGVALAKKVKKIAVLDGDGAILMHLGIIPFIGSTKPKHFIHFILDNQSYASTRGQPTISKSVEFDKIALASGYKQAYKVNSGKKLHSLLSSVKDITGPLLVWVKLVPGYQDGIERVSISPETIKQHFMRVMQEGR
jgi:phosphonopyruvate decarboxylase